LPNFATISTINNKSDTNNIKDNKLENNFSKNKFQMFDFSFHKKNQHSIDKLGISTPVNFSHVEHVGLENNSFKVILKPK
jgi:hypothetical protein